MKRRDFIKSASAGAIATIVTANKMLSAPLVLAGRRSISATGAGELIFRPIAVQNGIGPHLLDWAYASDENWDAFHANIGVVREGVKISDTEGKRKFGINVRWNV